MPRILVTNDDGVYSEGVRILARALERLGEVTIVAPLGESSAIGHALTLSRPLRLDRLEPNVWCVDGTPTDCVNLAVTRVLDDPPDLIVSGINKGYNLGDDVTYSGTVAGAIEGILIGIPSIAVSLSRSRRELDFSQAAAASVELASAVLAHGLPRRVLLNVNVPSRRAQGFKVTTQAVGRQATSVRVGEDPRGRNYYWIEEVQRDWDPDPRSDIEAVKAGWISVTPLQIDLTARDALAYVEGLPLGAKAAVE
jgi:5'-nucleotidase